MAVLDDINAAIQKGKKKLVVPLVQQAIDEGIPANDILGALLDGFSVIGDAFRRDEVFVPEVLVAARAMNAGTALLKPLLEEEGAEPLGKACLGTVEGDLHDIGKNIVRMMVEGKGIEVTDLGVDVPTENFIQRSLPRSSVTHILFSLPHLMTFVASMRNSLPASRTGSHSPASTSFTQTMRCSVTGPNQISTSSHGICGGIVKLSPSQAMDFTRITSWSFAGFCDSGSSEDARFLARRGRVSSRASAFTPSSASSRILFAAAKPLAASAA